MSESVFSLFQINKSPSSFFLEKIILSSQIGSSTCHIPLCVMSTVCVGLSTHTSVPLINPTSIPHCPDYCSFIARLSNWWESPSALLFFFKGTLAFLGP